MKACVTMLLFSILLSIGCSRSSSPEAQQGFKDCTGFPADQRVYGIRFYQSPSGYDTLILLRFDYSEEGVLQKVIDTLKLVPAKKDDLPLVFGNDLRSPWPLSERDNLVVDKGVNIGSQVLPQNMRITGVERPSWWDKDITPARYDTWSKREGEMEWHLYRVKHRAFLEIYAK